METDFIAVNIGVCSPVVREKLLRPGGIYLEMMAGVIRVENINIGMDANCHFAAVLRFAQFIPPVLGFLFHDTSKIIRLGIARFDY